MTILNHPNIHPAGLIADIADGLSRRLKGQGYLNRPVIIKECMDDIREFVEELENKIDKIITVENRK